MHTAELVIKESRQESNSKQESEIILFGLFEGFSLV